MRYSAECTSTDKRNARNNLSSRLSRRSFLSTLAFAVSNRPIFDYGYRHRSCSQVMENTRLINVMGKGIAMIEKRWRMLSILYAANNESRHFFLQRKFLNAYGAQSLRIQNVLIT